MDITNLEEMKTAIDEETNAKVAELRHEMIYAAHVLRYGGGRGYHYFASVEGYGGVGIGLPFLTGVPELDLLEIEHPPEETGEGEEAEGEEIEGEEEAEGEEGKEEAEAEGEEAEGEEAESEEAEGEEAEGE